MVLLNDGNITVDYDLFSILNTSKANKWGQSKNKDTNHAGF